MSNWGTTVRRIAQDVHRFDAKSIVEVKRAICYAVDDERFNNFHFNEDSFDLTLTTGTGEYDKETSDGAGDGYPFDYLQSGILTVFVNDISYGPLVPISMNRYRELNINNDWQGYPGEYVFYNKQLILYPKPNGAYVITGDYIKDIGSPKAVWDSSDSVWTFSDSLTGNTVTDTTSTAWFDEGQDLITHAAKEYLYLNVWHDPQEAMHAKIQKEAARKRLWRESRNTAKPQTVRKYY